MYKHLSLSERIKIESFLNSGMSIASIADKLSRSRSTISREIKSRSCFKRVGARGIVFNDCKFRFDCEITGLCSDLNCNKSKCRSCKFCFKLCSLYEKQCCESLQFSPYVCNSCERKFSCSLEKCYYSAKYADLSYRELLSESRTGISISEDEASFITNLVNPLLAKGHSFYAIVTNNSDLMPVSERSLYRFVEESSIGVKAIDLPRKVRFKKRIKAREHKVDKACRFGRSYEDFLNFIDGDLTFPFVELDCIVGRIDEPKVIMSISLNCIPFVFLFLLERKNSFFVKEAFESMYENLGAKDFKRIFSVILTDNGSEFSDPNAIEFDNLGVRRCNLFYCDPSAAYQKPHVEKANSEVRRILPKGTSFENLTSEDVLLIQNHINSYPVKMLQGKTPYEVFVYYFGIEIAKKLGIQLISPNDVNLTPSLIK